MQPIRATNYSPSSGAKTGPSGKAGKVDRKPARRRRLQQRGGAQLTLNPHTGKVEIRYV